MAAEISLPHPADAPVLDAYVDHVQAVLRGLTKGLGDGTASTITVKSLAGMGPDQLQTSDLQTTYHATQAQTQEYGTDLNSLDTKIADLAGKSADVANTAQAQVSSLVDAITAILDGVPAKPTLAQQFDAIGAIDKAVGVAEKTVSDASDALADQAGDVGGDSGGSSPATGGNSATPASYGGSNGGNYGGNTGSRGGSPGYGTPANAEPISGAQKVQAQDIYRYLISKGFSPAQAAGILGNMQVESSFNTGALNSAEGAIGLCQWEGGRRSQLEAFAASQGKPVTDWHAQVDFMLHELQGSHSNALAQIKSAQTPAAAAAAFDQYYEISAGTSRGQRIADATSIAQAMQAISV